jgi:hypothetical protein
LLGVSVEGQGRTFGNVQVYVAEQMNSPGSVVTSRYDDPAATRLRASANRVIDRLRAVCVFIAFGPVLGNGKITVRKFGRTYPLPDLISLQVRRSMPTAYDSLRK